MRRRRFGGVLAAAVATVALAAAPAHAHFCAKSGWSDSALAKAANSQAWLTAAEWGQFIDEGVAEGIICPAGGNVLKAQLAAMPENTLFMGPGLLAGGTLKNGKGNTPAHFSYLNFGAAFGACA